MTQSINTTYHALDTSLAQNQRASGVIASGVYAGFKIRPNGGSDNTLDIIPGNDATSILMTQEGVRIEEDAPVLGAATIGSADITLKRIDLVVAEYKYQASGTVPLTYKVIKGQNQVDTTAEPVKPEVENEFQVPLAYITVRPKSSFSGVITSKIELIDVEHVAQANWPDANAKPTIAPGDATRVYVYPGIFLSVDGRQVITFTGGYSAAQDPTGYADNEVRYIQYGVTDEGNVEAIGSALTLASLPDLTKDVFPIAIVKVRKSFSTVNIEQLIDIRFPYARKQSKVDEEDVYKDLLAASVFRSMRVERLVDDSSIDLTSVALESGADSNLTAALDSKDTSLTLTWAGTSLLPTEDAVIATQDLLSGGNATTIQHFMVAADAPVEGIRFQYSTSGSDTGFTATTYKLNEIIRVPAGGATSIYIKFVFPRAAFSGTKQAKLFSFALLYNLDDSVLNANTVGELGIAALKNSVNNLIANGDFYYWSRLDVDGNQPDLTTTNDVNFSLSTALDEINAADGWQATSIGDGPNNSTITRTHLTDLGKPAATALKYISSFVSGSATYLEYRVPVGAGLKGRDLTFAVDYLTGSTQAVGIGIAVYERSTSGLNLKNKYEVMAQDLEGTLVITTDSVVSGNITEIGFYIIFPAGPQVETLVWDARAVAGNFGFIPYTPTPAAPSAIRQFYERGRTFISTAANEGDVVAFSSQFGTPKMAGTLKARVFQNASANRSLNVSNISLDAQPYGVLVSSSATGSGTAVLDIDWEAYVVFDSSPAI